MFEVRADWKQQQAALVTLAKVRGAVRGANWGELGTLARTAEEHTELRPAESAFLWVSLGRLGELASASLLEPRLVAQASEEVLWLLECATEAGVTRWWQEQLDHWQALLDPELRSWLQCSAEEFAVRCAEAQAHAFAPETVEEASSESGDFERELLAAFLAEAEERLQSCEELLLALEKSPEDTEVLHGLFRHYHSLKGAAAAVGLAEVADQLHQGESLLQALRDREIELETGALVDFFLALSDSVRALVQRACGQTPSSEPIQDVGAALARLMSGQDEAPVGKEPSAALSRESEREPRPGAASGILERLQEKAAAGQLDPEVLALIATLEEKAQQFSARAAELEREIRELRTVPLEEVFRRLPRVLRDACRQERKEAELELDGGELRLPREWMEHLAAVLTHLVRNAVAHGIERPASRLVAGKARAGKVRVHAVRGRAGFEICVEDDGAGIDFSAVRRRAVALGLLPEVSAPSEAELVRCLFRPGFSTRTQANEVAGRGVGMDVVWQEIRSLGGDVQVRSEQGKGTRVSVLLPDPAAGGNAP